MMRIYGLLNVILILLTTSINAQGYKSIFSVGSDLLQVETRSTLKQNGVSIGTSNENNLSTGYFIMYRGEAHLGSGFYFDYAPGFFFSSVGYDGLQISINLRKEFDNLLCFSGIGSNINLDSQHGLANPVHPETYTFFYTLGTGWKISRIFGITASYNGLFSKRVTSGQTTDYISTTTTYDKNLSYFIRFGVEVCLNAPK
jgi:hypothetical protein